MRSPLRQTFGPLVLAALAFLILLWTIGALLENRREAVTQIEASLQDVLAARVAAWESELVFTLDGWAAELASSSAPGLLEAQMKQVSPPLVAAYVWRTSRVGASVTTEIVWPPIPPSEPEWGNKLCIREARETLADPMATADDLLRAYDDGCTLEALPVRLAAANEAAHRLAQLGHATEALALLDRTGVAGRPIDDLLKRGVPPRLVYALRLLRADILLTLGDPAAPDVFYAIGDEILGLPPQLQATASLLQYVRYPIQPKLSQVGRGKEARELEHRLIEASQRTAGFAEFASTILRRDPTQNPETRFIRDQYDRTDFILYYDAAAGPRTSVVLQLDQSALVTHFISRTTRLGNHLVVTDAAGTSIDGHRRGGPIAISVPFNKTLTHLRVGLRQAAVDDEVARADREILIVVAAAVVASAMLLLAFVALVRANQISAGLLQRQREFTTRVTHELKTPLAGIRVTAENLASVDGADDARVHELAERILVEVDRLTARVDEVLNRTRERKPPDPVVFDPEEIVLVAIDAWGPRLAQAGVRLTADLHATSEVRGDPSAITDAIACLLDNALKYHDPAKAQPEVGVTLRQEGLWVIVEVADNGLGVPPDRRTDIFDEYVRIEGPHRGLAGGHGLGLAQVAAIMNQHRGTARCTDGFDGGARFVLSLPALGPAPEGEAEEEVLEGDA
jgi:signal transduction histidine kinase